MHKHNIRKYSESKKKKSPNFLSSLKTANTSKTGKGEWRVSQAPKTLSNFNNTYAFWHTNYLSRQLLQGLSSLASLWRPRKFEVAVNYEAMNQVNLF